MCGIAGTLDLQAGLAPAEPLVARMARVLAHRGPDDEGLHVEPPVVLGHRRLAILDLSPAGHQPMASPGERFWITYNGEVYNYVELAAELEALGHVFASSCDTEVLLAAFAEWGLGCLERLNGMFAFAVWDRERQALTCVRDRLGVKPFYYTVAGGRFRFASELKALLLDPEVRRAPNGPRVVDFLAYGLIDHTPETLFEGVLQLPAGSYLELRPGEPVPEPVTWYRPRSERAREPGAATVRRLLEDAVRLRLRSDVPVGVSLSGGMDSSSVLALAALARREQGEPPPSSYSARSSDPERDEYRFSETLVEAVGSRNLDVLPTADGLLADLETLLWHLDEPFHAPSVYGHWCVQKLARADGVVVLLEGSGGDEVLGGYHHFHYPAFLLALLRRGRLVRFLRELRARSRLHGVTPGRSLKELARLFAPGAVARRNLPAWLRLEGVAPPRPPAPRPGLVSHLDHGRFVAPLPAYNHVSERNSMAFSIEARCPFYDVRLLEATRGLDVGDLLRDGYSKWALREGVRDVLPGAIVDRADKQGFTTDEERWLRGPLGDEVEEVFRSQRFASRPWFRPDVLLAELEAHRRGENRAWGLWRAYCVERWLQLFVDPERLEPPAAAAPAPVPVGAAG
jgi:asparagine synthase (glutamine-hydrolysing)